MNIIDITDVCNEDIEIIGVYNNRVYYFKGLTMDSECNIEVYYYDKKEQIENRIVYECIHTTEFYDKDVTTYETYAEVIFKNDTSISLFRIDFIKGSIDKVYSLDVDRDSFNGAKALGNRYLLVFTDISDINSENFNPRMDMEGFYESAYLYDCIEESSYTVLDKKLILSLKANIEYYNYSGQEYIMFEEVYMEQWQLEDMYILESEINDYGSLSYRESINIVLLEDLVSQIKNGKNILDMVQIHMTEINGWTRYFGMDKHSIYYRVKNFESGIEKIYKVSKKDFTSEKIGEVNHKIYEEGNVRYDARNQRIILDYPTEKEILVKGLYNFPHETSCKKGIGVLIEAANESYVVSTYWKEGEDNQLIDCVGIKNILKGGVIHYHGIAHVEGSNVVIYK